MEILQKLRQLEENIKILEELKKEITLEDLVRNKRLEWELRYGFLESIQIMIDTGCKIVNHFNLGRPQNYRECIELLAKYRYIDQDMSQKYTAMIGLRNLLIYEYAAIDIEKLYSFLDSVDDLKIFIRQIHLAVQ